MSRYFTDDRGRFSIERHASDSPAVLALLDRVEEAVRSGKRSGPPEPSALAAAIETARLEDERPSRGMVQRILILSEQCGLDRSDRMDLAGVLFGREFGSWNELTAIEAKAVATALQGFAFVAHLQSQHGRRYRYGSCPAESCPMSAAANALTTTQGENQGD